MKLTGRRTSGNVEDRRGMSGGAKGAMGVGGIVIVALIVLLKGGSLSDVFNAVTQESNVAQTTQTTQSYQPTAEEQEMATFASQILASTEDVWTEYFSQMGLTYRPPKMVLFSGSTQSGCGNSQSADRTFLLLGGSNGLSRPRFLQRDEEEIRWRRRLCLCLRDCS